MHPPNLITHSPPLPYLPRPLLLVHDVQAYEAKGLCGDPYIRAMVRHVVVPTREPLRYWWYTDERLPNVW